MQKFILKPSLVDDLSYAKTSSGPYYGTIRCNWVRSGTIGTFDIEVPPNTTAKVYIPAEDVNDVREGGTPVAQAKGVTYLEKRGSYVVFAVESGAYQFKSVSVPAAKLRRNGVKSEKTNSHPHMPSYILRRFKTAL